MRKLGSPFLASIYEQMLTAHYAMATINAYLYLIKFFIRYHQLHHPLSLGETEVQQFLTLLASERHVAAKNQAQALNALVFLYKSSLQHPLGLSMAFQYSSKSPKLPSVLTQAEVRALLLAMPAHLRLPPYNLAGHKHKKGRSMSGLLHNGISNQLSRRLPLNLRSLLKPPSRRSPLLLNGRSPWGRRSLLKGRSPRNGRSPRGGRLLVLPPAGTSV